MAKSKKVSPEYLRGFRDGMKKRNIHVIKNDLVHIYGAMGIVMHKRGYKVSTILRFIKEIQELWNDAENHDKSIPERLLEETGIDIVQMTCEEE